MNTPAIFLDRDGVINHKPPHYVKDWSEFRFLPGSLQALKELAGLPWPLIVVANGLAYVRRHHDWNLIAAQLESIYSDILSGAIH